MHEKFLAQKFTHCIIQDDEYRGKGTTNGLPYFRCGRRNAVWVPMDMVIYPPLTTTTVRRAPRINKATIKPSSDTGQQKPHEHTPAHKPSSETDQYVHIKHYDAEPQKGSTEFSKAKKMASKAAVKAWNYLTGSYAVEDMEQQCSEFFNEGDSVVAYSLKDQMPITATVRWTGMVKLSQGSEVPKAMFAGLETVSCMLMNLCINRIMCVCIEPQAFTLSFPVGDCINSCLVAVYLDAQ